MSREIKFRVVDEMTNQIVGFEFLKDGEWQHCLPGQENEFVSFGVFQGKKVGRQYKRQQATGLFDKNSNEYYEGDAFTHFNKKIYEIVYEDGSYSYNGGNCFYQEHAHGCELISAVGV